MFPRRGKEGRRRGGYSNSGRLLPIHLEEPSATSPNLKTNSAHSNVLANISEATARRGCEKYFAATRFRTWDLPVQNNATTTNCTTIPVRNRSTSFTPPQAIYNNNNEFFNAFLMPCLPCCMSFLFTRQSVGSHLRASLHAPFWRPERMCCVFQRCSAARRALP